MDMSIPPLEIEILLESNPLRSRIFVRRLAASAPNRGHRAGVPQGGQELEGLGPGMLLYYTML